MKNWTIASIISLIIIIGIEIVTLFFILQEIKDININIIMALYCLFMLCSAILIGTIAIITKYGGVIDNSFSEEKKLEQKQKDLQKLIDTYNQLIINQK